MFSHRLAPALTSVGLAFGILFTVPFARNAYPGIAQRAGNASRARISDGELIGRLTVSRLELDAPVLEGIASNTLARGAGHLPETAFPGEEKAGSPSAIAISRGSCARAIGRLRLGDRVRLATSLGLRRYRVVERRTFEPAAFRLDPTARVTLIAPFPPDSLGPAPLRLLVSLAPDYAPSPGSRPSL
jgi:sortase A